MSCVVSLGWGGRADDGLRSVFEVVFFFEGVHVIFSMRQVSLPNYLETQHECSLGGCGNAFHDPTRI